MFLRRVLLSGIATIALGGAAMAATAGTTAQATPDTGAGAPPYSNSTAAPGNTSTPGAMPGAAGPQAAAPAGATGTAIADLKNPKTALKSASVEASDGTKVGKVSKVHTDWSGQVSSIDVKVGANTVSLPAAQATFDESNKIVVAQLTADDIKALPKPGKSSSGMTGGMSGPGTNSPTAPTPQ